MVALGVSDAGFGLAGPMVIIGIPWLYSAGFEASAARATPGKRQARLVVSDAQGARIGFGRASLRFLGKAVVLATGGLGLLMIVVDRKRRAVDDFIAGTRVHDVEAVVGGGPRPLWRRAVGPVIVFAIIAVLAKIAIDSQREFQQRSRILELMYSVHEKLQKPYVAYYAAKRQAPTVNDLPFVDPRVRNFEIDTAGALVLHLSQPAGAVLTLTPSFDKEELIMWSCRVDAEKPMLFPANCRP